MKKHKFFAALTAAAVAICSVAAFSSAAFAAVQQEGVAEGNPVSGTETYCMEDKVRWQAVFIYIFSKTSAHAKFYLAVWFSEFKTASDDTVSMREPRPQYVCCLWGERENCQVNCNKKFHQGIKGSDRSEGESL